MEVEPIKLGQRGSPSSSGAVGADCHRGNRSGDGYRQPSPAGFGPDSDRAGAPPTVPPPTRLPSSWTAGGDGSTIASEADQPCPVAYARRDLGTAGTCGASHPYASCHSGREEDRCGGESVHRWSSGAASGRVCHGGSPPRPRFLTTTAEAAGATTTLVPQTTGAAVGAAGPVAAMGFNADVPTISTCPTLGHRLWLRRAPPGLVSGMEGMGGGQLQPGRCPGDSRPSWRRPDHLQARPGARPGCWHRPVTGRTRPA